MRRRTEELLMAKTVIYQYYTRCRSPKSTTSPKRHKLRSIIELPRSQCADHKFLSITEKNYYIKIETGNGGGALGMMRPMRRCELEGRLK